jgi:hypothetical protein
MPEGRKDRRIDGGGFSPRQLDSLGKLGGYRGKLGAAALLGYQDQHIARMGKLVLVVVEAAELDHGIHKGRAVHRDAAAVPRAWAAKGGGSRVSGKAQTGFTGAPLELG